MENRVFVITAAGGNGTAIRVLDHALSRDEYVAQGERLGKDTERYGAEQAGFLIPSEHHFEMAGGEFCGNAARSAALLLWEIERSPKVSFTMSGFDGVVEARVERTGVSKYFVECVFPGLPTDRKSVVLKNNQAATVVDLGGIVHVVIDAPFTDEREWYEAQHRAITEELGLTERSAVGVVWSERSGASVRMHPVVWVRAVNTFFYETSCGSGTIAVGVVTGAHSVVQPTGMEIEVAIRDGAVMLRSEMEVRREST